MGLKEYYNEDYNKLIEIDESAGSGGGWYKAFLANAEGLTILDVGCGSGSKSAFLVGKNRVIGLEINKKNIEKAKRRELEVIEHDIEQPFPFEDEYFDVVICSQVLEHLLQPKKTLREIYRVLKTGGYFFVDVPNHYGIKTRIAILFGDDIYHDHRYYFRGKKFDQWNYPHIRFFTYWGFRKVIEETGFVVVKDLSYISDFFKLTRILNILTRDDYPIQSIKSKGGLKLRALEIAQKLFKICGISSTYCKLHRPSLLSECFIFVSKKTKR